jgi:hypothetical protein
MKEETDLLERPGLEADPLLPGELLLSSLCEDAEHWVAVYEALTSFLADNQPDPPDMLDRYQRRLAYWRCRHDELRARV